jgi:ADP-heptose:LPS heptosyltransferase
MNTKTQLYIDKTLIKGVLFFINMIVRLVGKILHIDHSLNEKKIKTIAICKFKGLGSIIQATPLILNLKNKYKDAEIIFVTTPGNKEFLKKINQINTIVCLDDKNMFRLLVTFFSSIIFLIRKRIDVYVDLEIYSNFSSLYTTLTISKNRIGYYLRSSEYRLGIYTHMMYFNTSVPISRIYLQMARLLNCTEISEELFHLKSEVDLKELLSQWGILNHSEKYIVINVNASDLRLERRWAAENYVELIIQLKEKYPDCIFLLIGGKAEVGYVNELYLKIPNPQNVYNIAGLTNIEQLICIIQYTQVLITNDTGPMHIAMACKTKALALFGPCSPIQYGNNPYCIPIYMKVYCSPCVHEFETSPCNGNNQCMKLINVSEVLTTLNKALALMEEQNQDQTIYHIIDSKNNKDLVLGIVNRIGKKSAI